MLKMILERGPDQGYSTKPAKLLFIVDSPNQEATKNQEFGVDGLHLNFVGGSRYLGAYLGPREELDTWV